MTFVHELKCRFCGARLEHSFVDLGMSPVSNANIIPGREEAMEAFFPLHTRVCHHCWLVQLPEVERPEHIFKDDYAYFSSFSDSWLEHCRKYVDYAVDRFRLTSAHFVVEIASNDGYLLQYFLGRGIPVLGVEPAENVARKAEEKGIRTLVKFFGEKTAFGIAAQGRLADLVIGNNVLAHVPDINDFVRGLKVLLAPNGVGTFEFPHLLQLLQQNQFDTIYHEHYSYLSMLAVIRIFDRAGLRIFDVQELPTHGGSLRIHVCHKENARRDGQDNMNLLLKREKDMGLDRMDVYARFAEQVRATKRALLDLLIRIKAEGKTIVGYGAPAKGNTLLNYCGIRKDFLDYTVDRSPHKQGKLLPGTHIPVFAPEKIAETRPDYVLVLPWNLRDEITGQLSYIRQWGGKFILPIPRPEVL
jgi:SAM-dependent methyltransferase